MEVELINFICVKMLIFNDCKILIIYCIKIWCFVIKYNYEFCVILNF